MQQKQLGHPLKEWMACFDKDLICFNGNPLNYGLLINKHLLSCYYLLDELTASLPLSF